MPLTKPTGNITQSLDGKALIFTDTSSQTGIISRVINITDGSGATIGYMGLDAGMTFGTYAIDEDKVYNFNLTWKYSNETVSNTIPFISNQFYTYKVFTLLRKGDNLTCKIEWEDLLKAERCKSAALSLFKFKRYKDAEEAIVSSNILVGKQVTESEVNTTISNFLSLTLA